EAAARRPDGSGRDQREPDPLHPRLRAGVLHALRDPRRDGISVRRLPGTGVLLSPRKQQPGTGKREKGTARRRSGAWWASYFDEQYMLEYEPIFDLSQDRRDVARLIDLLG